MRLLTPPALAVVGILTLLTGPRPALADPRVGVAAVDITPDYPVRLSGFGFRRAESEGVTQRIWAKAIAFADDAGGASPAGPAVIVTVDNLGVPIGITREVAARLEKKGKLTPGRLAVTSSHTHTAPMLNGVAPLLFGMPVPPDQQARIDRYTAQLTDWIEQAALKALADLKPAKIEFGIGTADLAVNRRQKRGPVDHDLPVLVVRDPGSGKVRAVYASYACHCVTLSHNKVSGDWAGYLQAAVEKSHPGAVALTSIGCGADANPKSGVTGDKVDVAAEQGRQLASEIDRLLAKPLKPVGGPVATNTGEVELLFDTPPTREQWQERAKRDDAVGYHARVQLDRLDRGEALQAKLPYPVMTWTFGDDLAMVFLPGEVVVDYALRLKKDFDRGRLWVNAYSNDNPCYIPSERVLKEGGYEGEGAMVYYDRPTKFAPGLEEKIVGEVHRQLPDAFRAPKGTEGVRPKSPEESVSTLRTKPGLEVELAAAEPLVQSPVALDWAADGRVWVCEMYDYPGGTDGNFKPGGRVKVLSDTTGDGRYDTAAVFLDNIPFPTGVTCWGRGAFVCAAPDVLYAEDTDGDGRADRVEKLFTGFATDNYQARVNGLSLGLDNWVYGANGLLGGVITNVRTGEKTDIRNRDFRFKPLDGPLQTVTGYTQQGRVRDDWGRWFGCDNGTPLAHYPYDERYLRRNPSAPSPAPVVRLAGEGFDGGRIYPISRLLERFNDLDHANRFTSAGGLGLYRDTLLGEAYYGNAFTGEAVHNVVHRSIPAGEGSAMRRRRADGERDSEFLASTDNWFRPVQVRTGPDGAMYVVDMYRFLIEHPRWIAPNRLARLDPRAGADRGRIYRLRPAGKPLRPVRDLTKLGAAELAAALDSPNGTERDRVHVELLVRKDAAAAATLEKLARSAELPQVRVQALCALDGLGALEPATVTQSLTDRDENVRLHAVRLAERSLPELGAAVVALAGDPSPRVRRQLAYTLGEWGDARAGEALAVIAKAGLGDAETRIAVLSSAGRHCAPVLAAVMAAPEDAPGRAQWIPALVATAAAADDAELLERALAAALPTGGARAGPAHFAALASLLDALERRGAKPSAPAAASIAPAFAAARQLAADDSAPPAARGAAVTLLGRKDMPADDADRLCALAAGAGAAEVRTAAVSALRRQTAPRVAERLLADWQKTSPAARAELIPLLLGRDEWAAALLGAVKNGAVKPNELSLADRQQLASSASDLVRRRAAEVFPAGAAGARAEVVARYATVASLPGDASRGRTFFERDCAACHALGGVGHAVGPDLSALRDRDALYFVQNILDPGAAVEPRFVNYQVVLKDRRSLSGIIRTETDTALTLVAGNGVTETVARADVAHVRASPLSMMPEGFEAAYTPQQLADLVAFLKSGRSRKQFSGNTPAAIAQGSQGVLLLPAAKAEIYGDRILLETEYGNVGHWHGAGDYVAWTVRVDRAGEYDAWFDFACAESSAGNAFVLDVAGRTVTGTVADTGTDWSRYEQVKVGRLRLEPGEHKVVVRPLGQPRGALIDLRAVALAPPGVRPKFVVAAPQPPPGVADADAVARDPQAVAAIILDKTKPDAVREAAVKANPQFAAELIAEMTRDLKAGTPQEYERIPWIWRVAVACGRRDDAGQLKKVLEVALPRENEPLRDWQAVVLGGGVVMGASDRGHWPADRVNEILGDDAALRRRWQRAVELSSPMADDEKVPTPTRYDALRMLAIEPWEKRGGQLTKYLAKGTHDELQMGAVSGTADVNDPRATAALVQALPGLTERNRNLALDGLLRDPSRVAALLDAIEAGKVDRAWLGKERAEKLRNHPDAKVRERARRVLDAAR